MKDQQQRYELFPFQRKGVDRMRRMFESGCKAVSLADEAGLGKTSQCLTVAKEMGLQRVLILCPPTLRFVWRSEAEIWECPVVDTPDKSKPEMTDGWSVVGYSVIWRDSHAEYRDAEWDLVVLDESHFCKTWEGPHGNASHVARCVFEGLIPRCKRVIFSSATPMPSRPVELYGMSSVLNPNHRWFKSFDRYCYRYTGWGSGNRGSSNLPELRNALKPFIIRRRKKDVLKELPPKTLKIVELPQTAGMKKILDLETGEVSASADAIEKVKVAMEEARDAGSLKAMEDARKAMKSTWDCETQRLAAIRNKLSVPKAEASAEYVKLLLESGIEKVVVFFWHKAHADVLADKLESYGIARIDGQTPTGNRGSEVEKFQQGPQRVFLGQLRAAGTGITLTAASHVVISEVDWVPANVSQAIDRCHRIGATDNVTAHLLAVADSPDPLILKALVKKISNVREVIDGVEAEAKTKRTWFGRGCSPVILGESMTYDQKRWSHRELYRLHKITVNGSMQDGVGLNSSVSDQARDLAMKAVPTAEQYGCMLLILCRFHRQIDGGLPSDVVDVINQSLDRSRSKV